MKPLFNKNVREYLQSTCKVGQNYFPETVGKIVIVNAPWAFNALWSIAKVWLDEKTKQKIKNKRTFQLQYGFLSKKYIKGLVNRAFVSNKFNDRYFFVSVLESRLDVMLMRTNFVLTIRSARQLISHGNVLVNGEPVKCCSFLLKAGDKITFREHVHDIISYNLGRSSMWPFPAKHVQVSHKIFQIIVLENTESNLCNNFVAWFDWHSIMQGYSR